MTKEALHKVEKFVKVALSQIATLQNELQQQSLQITEKTANDRDYERALKKAAQAMYDSDFILDEEEKVTFVKKAQQDPKYLAKVIERVCNAADVSYMGKSANVKASTHSDDPVMRRAFGYDSNYSLLDD